MKYNPEYHELHNMPWSEEDLIYLVVMKETMKWADLSLALGRTHQAAAQKYYELKKKGLIEYYKNLDKEVD